MYLCRVFTGVTFGIRLSLPALIKPCPGWGPLYTAILLLASVLFGSITGCGERSLISDMWECPTLGTFRLPDDGKYFPFSKESVVNAGMLSEEQLEGVQVYMFGDLELRVEKSREVEQSKFDLEKGEIRGVGADDITEEIISIPHMTPGVIRVAPGDGTMRVYDFGEIAIYMHGWYGVNRGFDDGKACCGLSFLRSPDGLLMTGYDTLDTTWPGASQPVYLPDPVSGKLVKGKAFFHNKDMYKNDIRKPFVIWKGNQEEATVRVQRKTAAGKKIQ